MPKPPLIQYWHEPKPPDYMAELLETFGALNPELEHLVFDEAGARAFIESHLTRREVEAFEACAVPAMQADYFRYCAAFGLGGICVDADYRCVAPLWPIMDGTEGQLFGPGPILSNSLFGFRSPGHSLLELTREIATALIEQRFPGTVAEVTGPWIFSILHRLHAHLGKPGLPRVLDSPERRALMEVVVATIGSDERLAQAFEGVRVSDGSDASIRHRLQRLPERPPYKETAADWRKANLDIYRNAARGKG